MNNFIRNTGPLKARLLYAEYILLHISLKVCASNALIMLRPEEVEQLVCGCPTLDLNELRKVTLYDGGFKKDDRTIVDFWEVSEFIAELLIMYIIQEMLQSKKKKHEGNKYKKFTNENSVENECDILPGEDNNYGMYYHPTDIFS